MITIVLADDHDVVRQSLRALLEPETDFSVIGEAADGLEAIRLVESLQPDVLTLDLNMEEVNGLEVTRRLSKHSPRTTVVIFSMYGNEGYVLEALRAGVKAYVLKGTPSGELVKAIREAAAGRCYLSPPLSEQSIEEYKYRSGANKLGI